MGKPRPPSRSWAAAAPTSEPCLVLSPSSYRVQKQRGERATWGGRPPALLTLGPQPSFSASVPSSGRPAFSSLGLCFARRLGKRQRPPPGRACQLTGPVTEAGPSPARQPRHSPPPAWTDAPALVREGTLAARHSECAPRNTPAAASGHSLAAAETSRRPEQPHAERELSRAWGSHSEAAHLLGGPGAQRQGCRSGSHPGCPVRPLSPALPQLTADSFLPGDRGEEGPPHPRLSPLGGPSQQARLGGSPS